MRAYRTADHIAFHVDMSDVVGLLCWRPAREGGASRIGVVPAEVVVMGKSDHAAGLAGRR